jgi:2-polyprenyl-3-methyl-5-hydroxy-6-metoxy-1,4-benzoquinol methylase
MLDIGCGGGLLLALALEFRRIRRGIGLDTSEASIRIARACAGAGPGHGPLSFEVIRDPAGWPAGPFDVVTLIDVMHHLPAPLQSRAFSEIHSRLRPGGILVYKDMAHRPWLPALANRLHDLVLARQWIRYLPLDQAIEWARTAGFTVQATDRQRLWWYCHEMVVFARPPRD